MTEPTIERHPAGYDLASRFTEITPVDQGEGGSLSTAMDGDQPVLISDESTLADVLQDDGLLKEAVVVRRFATKRDRAVYLKRRQAKRLKADGDSVRVSERAANVSVSARGRKSSAGSFKKLARERQAAFRETLPEAARTLTDEWARYDHLLAIGHEDETLFPTLRGPGGVGEYFLDRGIQWWRGAQTGDPEGSPGPTRNLTSSQIACINLLLPLEGDLDLLTAILHEIDPEIVSVHPIYFDLPDGTAMGSFVELEWVGRTGTLEGVGSRGANATSADAFMIGATRDGRRRAFLFEFKYTEAYAKDQSKATGKGGVKRRARYEKKFYSSFSPFVSGVPFDELLYEPFYQIVRLGLLGDAMMADQALDLDADRVVIVCPEDNRAYRERITSPELRARFPEATTVEDVARRLWKRPGGFKMVDPAALVNAVRRAAANKADSEVDVEAWSRYMEHRYGW